MRGRVIPARSKDTRRGLPKFIRCVERFDGVVVLYVICFELAVHAPQEPAAFAF